MENIFSQNHNHHNEPQFAVGGFVMIKDME